MRDSKPYKIIFLNQMAGPMFRELAEDISKKHGPGLLLTGHVDTLAKEHVAELSIAGAPAYDRSSYFSRVRSWLAYLYAAFRTVSRYSARNFLFIVSNPPFLGLVGVLFKIVRRQPYGVLVYDVYPDILIGLGRMRPGLVARLWSLMNRMVYTQADFVVTLSPEMARRVASNRDGLEKGNRSVFYVPPWADVEWIKPLEKNSNPFVKTHGLQNKTIVTYSGNMGHSHSVERLLDVGRSLSSIADIHFLLIGEGAKWPILKRRIESDGLRNVTLLPFQREDALPFSMTAGDIGVMTYQSGAEGCMVPSKACYYMAAGLAIIVISDSKTDLADLVVSRGCGLWFHSLDTPGLAEAIRNLHENPVLLDQYKRASRQTAEALFSRKNTDAFVSLFDKSMHEFD